MMRWVRSYAVLPLTLVLAVAGCSLKAPKDAGAHGLKIIVQDQAASATAAGNTVSLKKLGLLALPAPAGSADFNCFMVNVAGQGISARPGPASCGLTGGFSRAGTGVVSSPTSRGSSIELDLPVGAARKIEIYGLFPSSEECGGVPGQTSGVYFLGSVTRDLFAAAEVTVKVSFAQGAAADLTCVPPSQDLGCTAGTNWSNLDAFNYTGATVNDARGIDFDQAGNIYAGGTGKEDADGHWIVRKSASNGTAWTTIDDYQLTGGQFSEVAGLITDDVDNIFAAGLATGPSGVTSWTVRASYDGGTTFSTVDQHQLTAGQNASASALDYDSAQNIYVAGKEIDGSGYQHWIVRKSSDSGATWGTVRDFQLDPTHHSSALGIFIDVNNRIWVIGTGNDASNLVHWLVDLSTDGGSTWTTKDDFQHLGNTSVGYGISVSDIGDVYAVGKGFNGTSDTWLVRISDDDGATWSTIDDYPGDNSGSGAAGISIAPNDGTIFVVGSAAGTAPVVAGTAGISSAAVPLWQVRASRDDGATWSIVDTVAAIAGGSTAHGNAIKVDALGNVYNLGARANASTTEWVVRKSACQPNSAIVADRSSVE